MTGSARRTAILFVLLLAAPAFAFAQQGVIIDVTVRQPADANDTAASLSVANELERALKAQGAVIEPGGSWRFYVSATAAEDMIAFTVVQIANLPEAMVEAGAEAELFYANRDPITLPPDGTFIRQKVTEDYLRDVGTVEQITTRLVATEDLAREVRALVTAFFMDHTR
ncbi:MAG: hypothetical protein AAGJ10_14735 [Bacteroidota bacterium]